MGTPDAPDDPTLVDDDLEEEEEEPAPPEPPQTPEQRLATAYHEAGHVIVAHEQNIYVRSVSIKERDGYAIPDQSDSEEFLRVLCAGREAELRHAPSQIEEANRGASVDEFLLSHAVTRMGLTGERMDMLRRETAEIVNRRSTAARVALRTRNVATESLLGD